MEMKRLIPWSLSLAIVFLMAGPAIAQEEEDEEEEDLGEKPTLSISPLPSDYRFDGIWDVNKWRLATDSIVNLTTTEPEEGGEPAGQTVVKVFADAENILVAVMSYDDNASGIVSFSKARDSDLEEEDHITVIFDTFLDGRSGYVFAVNPTGARFDGIIIEAGEDVNPEWDEVWDTRTSVNDRGWYAEIWIPINSIGFRRNLEAWGFNVERRVQRLQETSRWSGAKRDYEIIEPYVAGLLEDIPDFDFGLGLTIRPAAVGRIGQPEGEEGTETDGDISLDLTQRLGPNLLSALTVNTDFAETEVDVRQINLTRFPLFFPERRPFFLQASDIFEFGAGLDEETLLPYFSRSIGLLGPEEDDLSEIPINIGGRINGRVSNTNLVGLIVNTRAVDSLEVGDDESINVPNTTMGAARVYQNVMEQSTLGVIGTFGDQAGRSGAWTAGADFTYRTSNFLGDKNFTVGVWGLLNDREDLEGDKAAYGFSVEYPNDLFAFGLTSIHIGDGFDPSLGFVQRNDNHIWEFDGEYNPRPSWSLVRQMFHELSFTLFNKADNSTWESYIGTIKPLDWLLESGDQFAASVQPEGDRPPEPFEVSDEVIVPAGSYEWIRYVIEARTAEKRRVVAEVTFEFGDYYNGDLSTVEAALGLRPSAFFILELTGEWNVGTALALEDEEDPTALVQMDYTEELYGLRLELNFSPNIQFTTLTQYDTESRELGSNNRLRWTFTPYGELFVVYNHNVKRTKTDEWKLKSNELPIKLYYTWRF
jgi:hypothetical protein